MRKAKPTVVEDAVNLALDMKSYLKLHGQHPDTSAASVNNPTGPPTAQTELFSDLIFTIMEDFQRLVDELSDPPQRDRSGERPTRSRSQQSASNNLVDQGPHRSWNQSQRNQTENRGNTPNRGQTHDSKNRVSLTNCGTNSEKECHCCHGKVMTAKIVKPASNMGAWNIFGVIAAVVPNL